MIFLALQHIVAVVLGRSLSLNDPNIWTLLLRLLNALPTVDWLVLLLLDYYPDLLAPARQPLSHSLAAKGLGRRGCYSIPLDIWNQCVPSSFLAAAKAYPGPADPVTRPATGFATTMVHALVRDGFLVPCPDTVTAPPNTPVFLRPKSASKAAFIADLRSLNSLDDAPLVPFTLPSLADIAGLLSTFPGGTLWGTTLDLTNFFWSLRLPPEALGAFRVGSWCWDALPFGWKRAPSIAQLTLWRLIILAFAGTVFEVSLQVDLFLFHYYDDVLLLATSFDMALSATHTLRDYFVSNGLLISDKSVLLPAQKLVWLGKEFDLSCGSVCTTFPVLLHLLALHVLLFFTHLHPKLLQRVTGYCLWAARPHPGATLSLASWYRAQSHATRFWSHPSAAMRTGLADSFALACRPWGPGPAPPPPFLSPVICGDAAASSTGYQVGLFGPTVGVRLVTCPPDTLSQQQAELFAIDAATRLAVRLGWRHITYVGDNAAALHLLLSLRPRLSCAPLLRLCRRIRNRLLWSGLCVAAVWVPSALQPADGPSRTLLLPHHVSVAALSALDTWDRLLSCLSASRFLGYAWA